MIDQLGRQIKDEFDTNGNLTAQVWLNSGGTTVGTKLFTYNAADDMLTAGNSEGMYTFTYDNADRVKSVKDPYGVLLTFTYDGGGNRTLVNDSTGGLVSSVFDAADRLSSRELIAGGGGNNATVNETYNAAGRLTNVARSTSGTSEGATTESYDLSGLITGLVTTNPSSSLLTQDAYGYNAAGWLVTATVDGVVTHYGYDAAGQLLSAGATSYGYDANGVPNTGGKTAGSDNQVSSDGTWNYTYDVVGEMTAKTLIGSRTSWAYVYDTAGEMTSATETVSGVVKVTLTYRYDVFGNLTGRTEVDSGTTASDVRYVVDGWDTAKPSPTGTENYDDYATLIANGSSWMVSSWTMFGAGFDQPLAAITAGAVQPPPPSPPPTNNFLHLSSFSVQSPATVDWYIADRQGSITKVYTNSSTVVASPLYDAYGNITSGNLLSAFDFGYQGGLFDASSGLSHFGARWFNSVTQQWTSRDPLGLTPGPNASEFVGNGPTNGRDPSGEFNLGLKQRKASGPYEYVNPQGYIVPLASEANNGRSDWRKKDDGTYEWAPSGPLHPFGIPGASGLWTPAGRGADPDNNPPAAPSGYEEMHRNLFGQVPDDAPQWVKDYAFHPPTVPVPTIPGLPGPTLDEQVAAAKREFYKAIVEVSKREITGKQVGLFTVGVLRGFFADGFGNSVGGIVDLASTAVEIPFRMVKVEAAAMQIAYDKAGLNGLLDPILIAESAKRAFAIEFQDEIRKTNQALVKAIYAYGDLKQAQKFVLAELFKFYEAKSRGEDYQPSAEADKVIKYTSLIIAKLGTKALNISAMDLGRIYGAVSYFVVETIALDALTAGAAETTRPVRMAALAKRLEKTGVAADKVEEIFNTIRAVEKTAEEAKVAKTAEVLPGASSKPKLVQGVKVNLEQYRNSIGRYTMAEGTFTRQLDTATCVPSVLEQAIGTGSQQAGKEFAMMRQAASNKGGYTLEQDETFLHSSKLAPNAKYVESMSMKESSVRAKANQFTLINVRGSSENLEHAVGLSGYVEGKGFLIHDPLLGNYYQPYTDLADRLGHGVLTNIK